ncbi:MAG TPA: ABC transporter ATP-binding protein [Candidatus Cloacimonadota bacterium]|nr:ABC transporter ATP-binding protein [Candidatus Cloacimonadota bacterium]
MPNIQLEKVRFQNHEKVLLSEINLRISEGETLFLSGAGESGRSLLLKIMAGILPPSHGKVLYDGIDLYEAEPDTLKTIKREIGFSFQVDGLLSNLTVEENILLPVRFFEPDEIEVYESNIRDLLHYFSLSDTWQKRPAELSMQKKKVLVFIRSIIMNPKVLFLDDPFFGLDRYYQVKLLEYVKHVNQSGLTLVIVSNSEDLMLELADKILYFRNGKIERELNKEQITQDTLTRMGLMFIGA